MIVARSPALIRRERPGLIRSVGESRFGRVLDRPRRVSAAGSDGTIFGILKSLGNTTGLIGCWDAGDIKSYDGASQTFVDRSTALNDVSLGATTGAEASDPTFNGVAGRKSINEYFSFDAGDFFRLVAGSNPAAVEDIHKDGAKWSIMLAIYGPAVASYHVAGTADATTGVGFYYAYISNVPEIRIFRATGGTAALIAVSTTAINASAWNIIGLSIDEPAGAGGGFHWLNGAYNQVSGADTFNATYDTPSAAAASFKLDIGAINGGGPLPNLTRLGFAAMWSGTALTKVQMDAIWAKTRARYAL